MKKPKLSRSQPDDGDSAVSPVIAVILMVAITVVLAATVYVWVSGFTDTGDQAPSANFRYVSCNAAANEGNQTTIKLTSGGPLQMDDTRALLFNRTNDVEEATADPLSSSGQWSTGSQQVFGDSGTGEDVTWDANLSSSGGLEDGTPYRLDFVHKPTDATYASLPFTC